MEVIKTSIPEVIVLAPSVFSDSRGYFLETYQHQKYAELGILDAFVQDNQSYSTKNVLRGLHFQLRHPQAKLVRVTQGTVFDVAVDIRRNSPTFGKWHGEILSAENHRQLYAGLIWNDPQLGIKWPIAEPILSAKDAVLPQIADIFELLPSGE
jgi:dTDP-4-dehydrorhamnose 3,5-epimerase